MNPLLPIILFVILLCWARYLYSAPRQAAFFRQAPFSPATWGLAEIFGAFLLYLGATKVLFLLAQSLLHWTFPAGPVIQSPALAAATSAPLANNCTLTAASLAISNAVVATASLLAEERKLWIGSVGLLLAVLLSSSLIAILTKGRVGWSLSFAKKDLRLGLIASGLCLPVVFLVQGIVVQLPGMEYEHPLMRLLLESPSLRLWLALGFTAIIAAPIAEEFFFRGLLQGWLEQVLLKRYLAMAARREPNSLRDDLCSAEGAAGGPLPPRLPLYLSCLPILLSSLVFSAAHFNHGGGWVAIFVLALGLGVLYHKTHRLLPCILLHMALNATSFGLAYLGTQLK